MSNVLLSICIPTFNRASILDQCLEGIVEQKGFDYRTEIVILDNNSYDNTKDVVLKYSKIYDNVIYHKNEVNIGMEKNIINVLKFGNGKLLKLMNDYSLIAENMLEEMLTQVIENTDEKYILFFQNEKNKNSNIICSDLDSFFKTTTFWSTWIGTFAIWKSDFNKFSNTDKFTGLMFPHLLMFLDNFNQKHNVKIFFNVYISDIVGVSKGGYDFFDVFVNNFVGNILTNFYNENRIKLKTLFIVKSTFFNNFLKQWIFRIVFDSSHSFNSHNLLSVFKYFKFYPQLYMLIVKLVMYAVFILFKRILK